MIYYHCKHQGSFTSSKECQMCYEDKQREPTRAACVSDNATKVEDDNFTNGEI